MTKRSSSFSENTADSGDYFVSAQFSPCCLGNFADAWETFTAHIAQQMGKGPAESSEQEKATGKPHGPVDVFCNVNVQFRLLID